MPNPLTFDDNVDILNPNETRAIIAVDSQVLSKIQSCNQRAAYRHIDNIDAIDSNELALTKGLVIHEGLAEFYLFRHEMNHQELKGKVLARAESYAAVKTDLERDDVNNCLDALNSYMRDHQYETWKVKFRGTDPLVEKTFAKRMYEDSEVIILYTGVTDLIIDSNSVNGTPVDHKSFSGWFKAATMTNQFHGYCWAAESMNLVVNRVGVGKKVGTNERITVSYSPGEIEEWRSNTVYEILQHYKMMKMNWFRRNYEACEEYGGCAYKMLCNAQPEHRESYIKVHFKKVPEWSPLDRG